MMARRRGFITVEALTAIAIILVMTGILFEASLSYIRARNDNMLERTLRLAAQAQLERYRAGAPLDSAPPEGCLPPDVRLVTTTAPAEDPWAGMTKVTVTASSEGPAGRPQETALSGYFEKAPTP